MAYENRASTKGGLFLLYLEVHRSGRTIIKDTPYKIDWRRPVGSEVDSRNDIMQTMINTAEREAENHQHWFGRVPTHIYVEYLHPEGVFFSRID